MDKKQAITLVLSLMFLVGGVTASESAFSTIEDVTEDLVCMVSVTWFSILTCNPNPVDVTYADDNEDTLTDSIWGNGATVEDNRNQSTHEAVNYMETSYGIAMTRAKVTGIENLNNGSTLSTAQSESLSIVNDWYTGIEDQHRTRRNREILSLYDAIQKAETSSATTYKTYNPCNDGSSAQSGIFDVAEGISSDDKLPNSVGNVTLENDTVTMTNGSTHRSYSLHIQLETRSSADCTVTSATYDYSNYTIVNDYMDNSSTYNNGEVVVRDSMNSNPVYYVKDSDWTDVYNEFTTYYDNARANVNGILDEIYTAYESGEVNLSDYEMGSLEALKTASTNYNSTGLYSYKAVSLSQMGLETNDSYAFNVSWDNHGAEYGQLFIGTDGINDTLEVNKTYDATGERVEFVYQDGDVAKRAVVEDNFTIHSMENPDTGETVNQTVMQSYDFYTNSTEQLQEQILNNQRLLEQATSSGFTFSVPWFDNLSLTREQLWAIMIALSLIAILVAV